MKVGYMRLQALIRSRVLSHRFRHLRGHIVGLQARARGYLIRKMYDKKMWAIIKIQAHVRRVIAQRKFNKIKVNVSNFFYRKLNDDKLTKFDNVFSSNIVVKLKP